MVAPNDQADRDARGRFAPGNPGGPGGPRRRAFEMRRIAEEAVTPEMLTGMMRRAARMALEGNLSAIRFVTERVAGRAADVPIETEPMDIRLSRLDTATACAQATDQVMAGLCEGRIDRDSARLLLDGIQIRLKAIETMDLEGRLAELEKRAALVEWPRRAQ